MQAIHIRNDVGYLESGNPARVEINSLTTTGVTDKNVGRAVKLRRLHSGDFFMATVDARRHCNERYDCEYKKKAFHLFQFYAEK